MMDQITRPRALALWLLTSVTFGTLEPSSQAQTAWGVEGFFPSYGEFNAPPPLCPLPVAPPYAINFAPFCAGCPGLTLAPFGYPLGGSGVDNDGNPLSGFLPAFLNTDGFHVTMTSYAGATFACWPITPAPITGLDYDSEDDHLWVTDGFLVAAYDIGASCALPPLLTMFPLPVADCGLDPGFATGIAWDPCTDTIWTCHDDGTVMNVTVAGALISCCVAGPPLTGIAVNCSNGNLKITDGFFVAEVTPGCGLAPTGPFYLSDNPYPVPLWAAPLRGLGFSLRPQTYGEGCSPLGAPPTIALGDSYPYAGNPTFEFGQSGAAPGAASVLILGFDYACPPLPVAGCATGLWVVPSRIIPVGVVGAGGSIDLVVSLAAVAGCGLPTLYLQFANFKGPIPTGAVELSNALAFTIGEI